MDSTGPNYPQFIMQHLGVAVGAEVANHRHWNALTSLIFAEWGLLSSLDNG